MNDITWLRSHVERCLQDAWGQYPLESDGDGDYLYRWGTAACYVSIVDSDPRLVRVWAVAAIVPKRSLKLLNELNDINERARTAHVYWSGKSVVVEQAVHAGGVTTETLQHACMSVAGIANDIGTLMAALFGGHTPYPALDPRLEDEEAAS